MKLPILAPGLVWSTHQTLDILVISQSWAALSDTLDTVKWRLFCNKLLCAALTLTCSRRRRAMRDCSCQAEVEVEEDLPRGGLLLPGSPPTSGSSLTPLSTPWTTRTPWTELPAARGPDITCASTSPGSPAPPPSPPSPSWSSPPTPAAGSSPPRPAGRFR